MESAAIILGIVLILLQITREILELYKETDESDERQN